MRQGDNVYYFVTDHLGSTSLTLDANGNKIGEMKYYVVPRSGAEWAALR